MQNSTPLRAILIATVLAGSFAYYCFQRKTEERVAPKTRPVATVITHAPLAPPGAPMVVPVDYAPVAPQTAAELNDAVPIESAGSAALPFHIAKGTPTWVRATQCLAETVYYEARAEPLEGQRAVAQIVLNRVRSPAFPASICGVVYQGSDRSTGCQFTFTCDGSLKRAPVDPGWQRALAVAASAVSGTVYAPVGYATHYHANYVVPYWASNMAKVRVIGAHDFYRWPGRWRAGPYFSQYYANREPDVRGGLLVASALINQATETNEPPPIVPHVSGNTVDPMLEKETGLAADRGRRSLPSDGSMSTLRPEYNQAPVLQADLQHGKLEPTPAIHDKDL